MRKRLAMTAFVVGIVVVAALAAFRAPWYRATSGAFARELRLTELDVEAPSVLLVALLVNVYFFVRLACTGILLVNGGPTSTRVIAWYTPFGAHVQGGFALVAAVVMNVLTPVHAFAGEPLVLARSWGGPLLVGCNVLAQLALFAMARDRTLARTQTWVDDDGTPIPKRRRRWIRAARHRPLVKSPLPPAPAVGGDPFRAPPPTGLAAAIVPPPAKVDAPRVDDDAAPAPKLLT